MFCSLMWHTALNAKRASKLVSAAASVLVLQSAYIQPWAVLRMEMTLGW